MDRTDRHFLQTQLRGLDQMIRDASDMRSVLLRRIRRMEAAPLIQRRRPIPVNLIPVLAQEVVVPQQQTGGNRRMENIDRGTLANRVHKRIPIVKTRNIAIKKSEWNSVMTDACGICLEIHKTAESCVLNCKHRFGQECFDGWNRICSDSRRVTTCPTCREPVTVMTNFRQRQSNGKPKPTMHPQPIVSTEGNQVQPVDHNTTVLE